MATLCRTETVPIAQTRTLFLSGLGSLIATVAIFWTDSRTWIGTRVRVRQCK